MGDPMKKLQFIRNARRRLQDAGIDSKFFDLVSQFAHFFTMYSLALTVGLIGKRTGHALLYHALSVAVYITYAAIHEFYWDPRHENAATRGSDLKDFAYLVGGGISGNLATLFLA
jgi:hypothetical protein